jgi:hypothetical protein
LFELKAIGGIGMRLARSRAEEITNENSFFLHVKLTNANGSNQLFSALAQRRVSLDEEMGYII